MSERVGDPVGEAVDQAYAAGYADGATERDALREQVARAWEDGFNAHRTLVAQVAEWNASEGEAEVVEPLNPYRAAIHPAPAKAGGEG